MPLPPRIIIHLKTPVHKVDNRGLGMRRLVRVLRAFGWELELGVNISGMMSSYLMDLNGIQQAGIAIDGIPNITSAQQMSQIRISRAGLFLSSRHRCSSP
jgi:hypothetical protein